MQKWLIPELEKGEEEMSLEHSLHQKGRKWSKDSDIERIQDSHIWNNLSIKINDDRNVLIVC